MTYLAFHAVFILPPIIALAAWLWPRRHLLPRRAGWALPAIALIAFTYTTPWDNYLVARGVWRYGADRVLGTLHYRWREYQEGGYVFGLHGEFDQKYGILPPQ